MIKRSRGLLGAFRVLLRLLGYIAPGGSVDECFNALNERRGAFGTRRFKRSLEIVVRSQSLGSPANRGEPGSGPVPSWIIRKDYI